MHARTAFWTTLLRPPRAMKFPFTLGNITNSPANLLPTARGFTLESWVYVEAYDNPSRDYSGSQERQILFLGCGPDFNDYSFICTLAQGKLAFYSYLSGVWVYAKQAIPVKTWCHVAVVLQADGGGEADNPTGTLRMYLNGQLADLVDSNRQYMPYNPKMNPFRKCYFGNDNGYRSNAALYGMLDEVRFWSEARSETDIRTCFNRSNSWVLQQNPANLLACYDFDEEPSNSSPLIRDGSGHGLHLGASTNGWENVSVPSTAPLLR